MFTTHKPIKTTFKVLSFSADKIIQWVPVTLTM